MAWWLWIVLGTALLAAELFLIEADFDLVFLGTAAIAVGFADVAGLGGPAIRRAQERRRRTWQPLA